VGDVIDEEDCKRCEEERPADQFVMLTVIRHEEIVEQLKAVGKKLLPQNYRVKR
jgi:hypothetical protein